MPAKVEHKHAITLLLQVFGQALAFELFQGLLKILATASGSAFVNQHHDGCIHLCASRRPYRAG